MKFVGALPFAGVCCALLLTSGCQTTAPPEAPATPVAPVKIPSAETPRDQALSKSVRAKLLSVKTADLSGVQVVSSAGTVYLSGNVASLEARQQAVTLAWTVPGVQSVVNALEVRK